MRRSPLTSLALIGTLCVGIHAPAEAAVRSARPPAGTVRTFTKLDGVRAVMTVQSADASSITVSVDVTDTACDGYWSFFYLVSRPNDAPTDGDGGRMRTHTPVVRECDSTRTFSLAHTRNAGETIYAVYGCPVIDRYRENLQQMYDGCEQFW